MFGKMNAPINWKEFLRVDENQVELFEYLTTKMMKRCLAKRVYAIYKDIWLFSHQDADTDYISLCNHISNLIVFLTFSP